MAMFDSNEILSTLRMIDQNKLDVRTITMGISLLDCACGTPEGLYDRVYDRITKQAQNLVATGEALERDAQLAEEQSVEEDLPEILREQ